MNPKANLGTCCSKLVKRKILKVAGGKNDINVQNKVSMIEDFLSETMQAPRQWSKIFKGQREKTINPEF